MIEVQLPRPRCKHGMKAYTDLELGQLDDSHMFCPACGEVVCLKICYPDVVVGRCLCGTVCNAYKSGKFSWHKHSPLGEFISGGNV